MGREGEFYLAKIYLTKPNGHLYSDKSYKIRPVLIIEDNGKIITCWPITSQLNIYPASKAGRARIDIGPWYVDKHSQIICDKPTIVLPSHLFKRISICRPEDFSVIIQKYRQLKQEKYN